MRRTGGFGLNIDVRKIGLWMLGLGGVAMTAGLVADAVRTNDDPSIASSEGIFDLSSFGHALFFGGICIAFVGLLGFMFGGRIYRQGPYPEGTRPSVGRRLVQVGAPIAALLLITGCTAVAMNSDLGDPAPDAAGDHHAEAGTDDTATAASTEGATTESGHAHDETASATAGWRRRGRRHRSRAGDRRDRDRRLAVRDRVADAGVARPGRDRRQRRLGG